MNYELRIRDKEMSNNHSQLAIRNSSLLNRRKAFTLVELLVVIGIMGLMGTVSVGGYNAMKRGMEERGVMENADAFVRTAYERAQIDRQPTAIFFWNETIRSSTLDENEVVVGRAVAVRRQGRISMVSGELLIDEFADLEALVSPAAGQSTEEVQAGEGENVMFLYRLDNQGSTMKLQRSVVYDEPSSTEQTEVYLQGRPNDNVGSGELELWGYKLKDRNGVDWQTGSAYGFEFAELTLPHGYIFGTDYSETAESPVREAGTMVFSVVQATGGTQAATGGTEGSMTVYALRPNGSGGLETKRVGTVAKP